MVPEIMARWDGKVDELLKAVVETYKNQVMHEEAERVLEQVH